MQASVATDGGVPDDKVGVVGDVGRQIIHLSGTIHQEQDAALQRGTALSRVAHFILKGGPLIASGRQAPFSKRHVAALIGLRPETLSRCLRELEGMGVISAGRKITVLDEARLRELSEGKQE